MTASSIRVDVAPGELIDKITILAIKLERLSNADQLANVRHEYELLTAERDRTVGASDTLAKLTADLKAVNERLWVIEDAIRDCERAKDFGAKFVELARAVYHQNDQRAQLKREINLLLGSAIIEEKSYAKY